MHDGVVLKDHRQAGVGAEQRELDIRALARKPSDGDRYWRLASDSDLQVGGAVTAVDLREPPEEIIAQSLRHAFAARETVQVVFLEGKTFLVGNVDEMLQKRRIPGDEVGVFRAEEAKSVEDLGDIGAGVLDDPVLLQRDPHVDPGSPRAHAEAIDRDPWLAAVAIRREITDEGVTLVALLLAAHPVVRRAGRAG